MPLKQLVEFERFSDLAPKASAQTTFSLDPYVSLALTAANGSKVVYPVRMGTGEAESNGEGGRERERERDREREREGGGGGEIGRAHVLKPDPVQ